MLLKTYPNESEAAYNPSLRRNPTFLEVQRWFKILRDFVRRSRTDRIGRREVVRALGLGATAALAASVLPEATTFAGGRGIIRGGHSVFKAVAFNHINYQVADYAKMRDFYVNLYGMKVAWDDGKQCWWNAAIRQTPYTFAR